MTTGDLTLIGSPLFPSYPFHFCEKHQHYSDEDTPCPSCASEAWATIYPKGVTGE